MSKKFKSQEIKMPVKEMIEQEVDKVIELADTLVPKTATPAELDELTNTNSFTLPITKTGEGISPEDLAAINKAKQKVGVTALRAQNAILENQMAELEQKNLTFSLFVKYRLTELDQINETTGEIIRGKKS